MENEIGRSTYKRGSKTAHLKPSYTSVVSICNDCGEEMNQIIYEIYNTKGTENERQ